MNSILIGKIVNTHGIKGEMKVYPYTDDIENLTTLKQVFLDEALTKMQTISTCRVQKNMLLMKLKEINTVEEAQMLRDQNLYILKEESLEEDTYYIEDLIGLEVIDMKNETVIGTITYVFQPGANDVYEVETPNKEHIYLPAIKQVVKNIDLKNNKMYVEMMEGL